MTEDLYTRWRWRGLGRNTSSVRCCFLFLCQSSTFTDVAFRSPSQASSLFPVFAISSTSPDHLCRSLDLLGRGNTRRRIAKVDVGAFESSSSFSSFVSVLMQTLDSLFARRLITLYQTVHEALHPRAAQAGSAAKAPAQVQYVRTEHEAVLGWVRLPSLPSLLPATNGLSSQITPAFELYVCTSPLLPHSAVVSAARAVSKWVQKEEARLFLMSAPSF